MAHTWHSCMWWTIRHDLHSCVVFDFHTKFVSIATLDSSEYLTDPTSLWPSSTKVTVKSPHQVFTGLPQLYSMHPHMLTCFCILQFDITFKQLKKFKYNFNIPHLTVKQNNFAFSLELLKFSKSRSLCTNNSLTLIKDLPPTFAFFMWATFSFPNC